MSFTPDGFDFMQSIDIVVMVILGGMGNTAGVILAAILLTLLPEFLRPIRRIPDDHLFAADHRLMLTRPQGLFSFGRKSDDRANA